MGTCTARVVAAADSVPNWTAFIRGTMDARRVQLLSPGDFFASAQRIQFGSLAACRIHASPHRMYCEVGPGSAARTATAPPKIHVHFQLRGHTQIEQGHGRLALGPGDWSINALPESYHMQNLDAVEHLTVLIPIEDRPVDIDRLRGLSRIAYSSDRGIGRIFQGFVVNSFDELQRLGAGTDVRLSAMVVGLFRSALEELAGNGQVSTSRAVVAERIRALVAARLTDPAFSIDEIATTLRCTKRYVHLAFREHSPSETLSEYILRERLFRCRQELASAGSNHKGIARIAYEWGFADAAYFSRAFRAHFRLTPRRFRQECQRDLAGS